MKTITGDLWQQKGWLVIPTNLTVKVNGEAVMGRGVAHQAAIKYPDFPRTYGMWLECNRLYRERLQLLSQSTPLFYYSSASLIALPVKNHWSNPANMEFIKDGVANLRTFTFNEDVFLPLIGCGYGELQKEEVLPLLELMLDDRFTLVLRDESIKERYPSSFRDGVRKDRS